MKIVATDTPAAPTNCFELVLNYSHGDADAETTETFQAFRGCELVRYIEAMQYIGQNGGADKVCIDNIPEEQEDLAMAVEDILISDVTNHDRLQSPEYYDLYYYNGMGARFEAKILLCPKLTIDEIHQLAQEGVELKRKHPELRVGQAIYNCTSGDILEALQNRDDNHRIYECDEIIPSIKYLQEVFL